MCAPYVFLIHNITFFRLTMAVYIGFSYNPVPYSGIMLYPTNGRTHPHGLPTYSLYIA